MDILTRQDLIYAASALRESAHAAKAQGENPTLISSSELFLRAYRVEMELAEKFDRIAKRMGSADRAIPRHPR